jgi:hypothetical protein
MNAEMTLLGDKKSSCHLQINTPDDNNTPMKKRPADNCPILGWEYPVLNDSKTDMAKPGEQTCFTITLDDDSDDNPNKSF